MILACFALAVAPAAARAQVLEIGDGGAVTRYDGPAVYTREGAAPITPAAPHARHRGSAPAPSGDLQDAAREAKLSAALIEAIAWRESRMRAGLVSRAGAVGEMQLMPGTARALGVDPWNSRQNYSGGAGYIRMLLKRYDGDLIKTLAAYDAGPAAVDRYGGMPPFKETQDYVAAILEHLSRMALASEDGKTTR